MKLTLWALAGALICGAWKLACAAPAPPLKPIAPGAPHATEFAPLAYFNQNCARCHGEYGSFYGDDFGKKLNDAQIREVVDQMAKGPAGAPLEERDLNVLVAWHRALRDGKPFIAVVKAASAADSKNDEWTLSGEISPDARLEINRQSVEVKDGKWSAPVAAGAFKLRAQKGEAVTELDASAAAFAP